MIALKSTAPKLCRRPTNRPRIRAVAAFAVAAMASSCVLAETFPARPVSLVVPFAPGGTSDITARVMAEKLQSLWKQPVIIENKAGGGSVIGASYVARAAPDGYTLLFAPDPVLTALPLMNSRLNYDPDRDFTPVVAVLHIPSVIMVNVGLGVSTLSQLVERAKAHPGSLNYASFGPGSAPHLGMELFKRVAGVDIQHVPYKGVAPAFNALEAGEVQVLLAGGGTASMALKSERVRILAIDSPARLATLPDVPTFAESGFAGVSFPSWWAIVAPSRTPPEVLKILNRDMGKVLADPGFRKDMILDRSYLPAEGSRQYLADLIRRTTAQWAPIIKDARIRLDE